MSLSDKLVAFGVLATFLWIIVSGVARKSPRFKEFLKSLTPISEKIEPISPNENVQQVWQEKRSMI